MQLLKAAAFVPEIKDAIMECFRAAAGMTFAQYQEPGGEYIAYLDHPCPGCGHLVQIGLSAGAEGNHLVNHQQLRLQSRGLLIERCGETSRETGNPAVKVSHGGLAKLLQVR
jgi:hypothetical protein